MEPLFFSDWKEAQDDLVRLGQQTPLVFTNGCFDLFHVGHVSLLSLCRKIAASRQAKVFVALNHDSTVRRLKGKNRPLVPFFQRATILLSVRYVDVVCGFLEETPEELLAKLRPDVIVKGEEYASKDLPGRQHCREVVFAPEIHPIHTTQLIQAIAAKE